MKLKAGRKALASGPHPPTKTFSNVARECVPTHAQSAGCRRADEPPSTPEIWGVVQLLRGQEVMLLSPHIGIVPLLC